jgi:peptide/nickel transport system permease protein
MSAWVYAARRLMLAVPLLLGMSVLVFGLMRLVPGDPAVTVLGYKATPEAVRALREAFHLDEPLPRQYLAWLGGVARGDFGLDFRQNEPIGRMILDRLPVTLELTLLAAFAAALIGVPLGLLGGGGRRGGAADRASLAVGLLGVSLPDFWLGIMLILLVSLGTGLLPSSGFVPFTESPVENLQHLILPAITLAASRAAVLGRLTRAAVLDTVRRGFVQYARAKGLAERAVLFRHVLPNAAIPIVTVLGLQTGYMLGGAIVVETIFTLPGVGRMTLDAVLERNYPVVQGTLLVIGAMFMLVNLVTDILYGVIDPRVRSRDARGPARRWAGPQGVALAGLCLVGALVLARSAPPRSCPAVPPRSPRTTPCAARPLAEPFGMDDLGRSVLSRVVHAYRVSLGVAVGSVALALLIGGPLGLIAGYAEGVPDQLIMRPLDVLMAFPAILLAIALMSVFGTGAALVSISLAVVYTPVVARVVRAAVIAAKVEVYVDGARALGATVPRWCWAISCPMPPRPSSSRPPS